MIVQSFGSGSSGNSLLLKLGETAFLVDCGLSPRTIKKALMHHKVAVSDLQAILITHEHDDHVRGLQPLLPQCRAFHATAGTVAALGLSDSVCRPAKPPEPFVIDSLQVTAIPTSHDAAEPCGFSFFDGQTRVTILTDFGEAHDGMIEVLATSDLIVIEANHDLHMLRSGPYPEHLKRRVLSARGHFSNADCGALLARALATSARPRTIWLAHLSATNNRPELAVRTVRDSLAMYSVRHRVVALPRRELGPVWTPEQVGAEQLSLFG